MTNIPRGWLVVIAFSISGCSQKLDFYEYDGGMINLQHVRNVSTESVITLSAEPRRANGIEGSYDRAIFEAHDTFCTEWRAGALDIGYTGSIIGAPDMLEAIVSHISRTSSYEVLATCKVTLTTRAFINLDNFSIRQESGTYSLPIIDANAVPLDKLPEHIKNLMSSNITQPNSWLKTYNQLRARLNT